MAQIGLRQAARLSGKNQSTLHGAMKAGGCPTRQTRPASGASTPPSSTACSGLDRWHRATGPTALSR